MNIKGHNTAATVKNTKLLSESLQKMLFQIAGTVENLSSHWAKTDYNNHHSCTVELNSCITMYIHDLKHVNHEKLAADQLSVHTFVTVHR